MISLSGLDLLLTNIAPAKSKIARVDNTPCNTIEVIRFLVFLYFLDNLKYGMIVKAKNGIKSNNK